MLGSYKGSNAAKLQFSLKSHLVKMLDYLSNFFISRVVLSLYIMVRVLISGELV